MRHGIIDRHSLATEKVRPLTFYLFRATLTTGISGSTYGSEPMEDDCSLVQILQPGLSRRLRTASESLTAFQIYIDKFRQQYNERRF